LVKAKAQASTRFRRLRRAGVPARMTLG
jgi:hypothetical protein